MGEPESPAGAESPPEPAPEAPAAAESEPPGLLTAAALRQLLLCAAGWMFAGMAAWILLLDPLPKGGAPAWPGWRGRDVLVTVTAAYCLRGMANYVWAMLLYQRELRGRPP